MGSQRFGIRVDDDTALGAVHHDGIAMSRAARQPLHTHHCRQAEGSRHDGRVAVRSANFRREARDGVRVQQRGVGWRQVFGDDDRAAANAGESAVGGFGQVADQPLANVADVGDASRKVAVAHCREGGDKVADLFLHGSFGIHLLFGDAVVDAAHQT